MSLKKINIKILLYVGPGIKFKENALSDCAPSNNFKSFIHQHPKKKSKIDGAWQILKKLPKSDVT